MEIGDIAQKPYNKGMLLAEKHPIPVKIYHISAIHILNMWQCVGLLNVMFCHVELTLREETSGSRYISLSAYLTVRYRMVSLECLCLPVALIPTLSWQSWLWWAKASFWGPPD